MTTTLTGQLVRIDSIDFPPEYERKASLVEDDALRRSVEKSGVQQSAVVMPSETPGRYTLVKGGRRLMIAENKGDHTIPVVISVPPTGTDPKEYRNRLRFILTQARQDLLPSQRANLIKQLMSMFGMNQKQIAAMLGVDAGSLTNWLAILNYNSEVVASIDSGEITAFSARALDGLTPEGQAKVFKQYRKQMREMSGGKFHRLIRDKFTPDRYPEMYVAPEKTKEKLKRKQVGRKSKRRPKLTRSEKDLLSRDLSLREVELQDGQEELKQLKRECAIAAPPLRAIKRNAELWAMVPEAAKEEIERFLEVY